MFQILNETFPIESLTLTATVQPLARQSQGLKVKPTERPHIAADTIVLIVPAKLGGQCRPPCLCLLVIPYLSKPVVHLFAFLTKFLPARLTAHNEFTLPARSAEMGKAQKVKGVGLPFLSLRVLAFVSAKTDGSRLLGVKLQSEFRESLSQYLLYVPGAILVLDHADKIIRITHHITCTSGLWFDFLLEPQVKHIVQEYIG